MREYRLVIDTNLVCAWPWVLPSAHIKDGHLNNETGKGEKIHQHSSGWTAVGTRMTSCASKKSSDFAKQEEIKINKCKLLSHFQTLLIMIVSDKGIG